MPFGAGLAPGDDGTSAGDARSERRAALWCGGLLMAVYVGTLAPGLTLWDAGEFQSAVASLGIPHPPGAPLYVMIGRVWSTLLVPLSLPLAMNLLSAVASAVAGATIAALFTRWLRSAWVGCAAGCAAGLTYSVWFNATETEVYALSFAAGLLLVYVGDGAGERSSGRLRALLVYLLALSAVLHLDALVAAPAALLLAASPVGGGSSWRSLVPLGAAFLCALGVGQGAPGVAAAGAVGLAVAAVLPLPGAGRVRARDAARDLALIALGGSVVLFLLVRAAHDPAVNQGNPSTPGALLDVVARAQYDVPGLLPRRAPLWLQVANFVQYADWQVAFGLDDWPGASWRRTPWSVLLGVLAVIGARAHWRADRRSARAWAVYLAAGSLGAIAVLNLQAGPSMGWGVLPAWAGREARERDYFFVAAFAALAAWSAVGAAAVARRLFRAVQAPAARWAAAGAAAVPLVLNWGAVDRRREPDASIPTRLADALLASTPRHAVLLLAGDNDSYAVWQAQTVRGLRRDVTPVTLPLLPADWYRAELARRHGLASPSTLAQWRGEEETLRDVVRGALARGRPVAVAVSVSARTRGALAPRWRLAGMAFVQERGAPGDVPITGWVLDSAATATVASDIAARRPAGTRPARDPTGRYLERLLGCPGQALQSFRATGPGPAASLDPVCNFR
jgi:hypothetical protein